MTDTINELKESLDKCQRELRTSKRRFQNIINKNADGILIVAMEGVVRFANPAAESIFGRHSKELVGEVFGFPLVIGERTELDLVHAGGEIITAEMRVTETEWENEPCHLVSLRDITERKQAESALSERIKELTCLYAVHRDMQKQLPLADLCERIVENVAAAMQYPEIAVPVIELDDQRFTTGCCTDDLSHGLQAEIIAEDKKWGDLWVYYAEPRPFLTPEEQYLLDGIAEALGLWLHHRQTEEALRESEERYQMLFQNAPMSLALISMKGQIITSNNALTQITGYTTEELKEINIQDLYRNPSQYDQLRAQLQRDGRLSNVEIEIQRKDGTTFHSICTVNPITFQGEPVLLIALQDITRRKKAEQALQEAHDQLEATLKALPDFMFEIDRQGHIHNFYSPTLNHLEQSREDFIGQNIEQVFPQPAVEVIMDALDEAAAKGKHTGTTYRMDNPGGTTWFELSASTLKAPPDGAEHFIVITRDVTERKQAKQSLKEYADRLAHSNVQLERFAFVASHHLQEPLRTVISHLQLLESRYKDQLDDQAQTHIEYPVKAALHMRTLIRDLLNFSATESGRSVFTLTDCEVIVKQALEALQDIIEEKKGEVTHDPLPKVMADKVQLTQLFQNLIANAIKFHREDEAPRVHISASRSENAKAWRFSIRDNGIGIAPAYHERVFEIFERLHTREEYPGTGIGLAICRKIVERHGGRIWVRSEPGKGSTFHFTIPAEEDAR